ncbi:MAG TPA: signal peptide peptidase SppA [Steroidobacteraceae bacterium]|jgi:protease-4
MSFAAGLRGFFGLVWRILDGVRRVLHLLLMLVLFGFLLAALHTSIPNVPHTAALVIAPEGELVEQMSIDGVRRAFGEASGGPAPETLLRDVTEAIEAAKDDARIKILVLDLDNLELSGLSKLQEIAAAIRDFRAAGKRVVSMGDSYDQTQYYLAAQAGEVYLDPTGAVDLDGFSYYRMYYKDGIDKLGVDFNIFRAGTYKSYTDQFTRNDMAASDREEAGVWLQVLWNAYTQDVARARSLAPGAINEYVNELPADMQAESGDAAKLALRRGLVTALKSRRQVADDLRGLVGEDDNNHSFNAVSMNSYLSAIRAKRTLKTHGESKVGIVVAAGEISDGRAPPGSIGGESTSDLLRQARFDSAVKAVVLRVDSPGGSEFAAEEILREVQALRNAGKPVVVSMSTYAASGGYYIAAAANQIFASPTTITGSIGVFSFYATFQKTLEKLGVTVDGFGTTPLAGAARPDRAMAPGEKQILQAAVEHAYQQFLHRVAEGRKKSVEDIDKIAQGRVWAGLDAQRLGLVDHLGGLKDATEAAAKLADLGSDYDVDYIEQSLSLKQELLMQIKGETSRLALEAGLAPQLPLREAMDPLLKEFTSVAALSDPRHIYSYCWCTEPASAADRLRRRTEP